MCLNEVFVVDEGCFIIGFLIVFLDDDIFVIFQVCDYRVVVLEGVIVRRFVLMWYSLVDFFCFFKGCVIFVKVLYLDVVFIVGLCCVGVGVVIIILSDDKFVVFYCCDFGIIVVVMIMIIVGKVCVDRVDGYFLIDWLIVVVKDFDIDVLFWWCECWFVVGFVIIVSGYGIVVIG